MNADVRICWGEDTQTLSIEADTPFEAWCELGAWAGDHRGCWIRQASLFFDGETCRYWLTAYFTYL